ncbi:MAG: hypothetical protein AB1597_00330 [Chloroflexota bacterium]
MSMQGQDVVNIVDMDAKIVYTYIPAMNMAMKQTLSETQEVQRMSPVQTAKVLAEAKPSVIGSETIDGKDCMVVQATIGGQATKIWIWKEYGMPVRMEAPNPHGGTMVTEWKNIEVVDIPDRMFELPAGVRIQQQ